MVLEFHKLKYQMLLEFSELEFLGVLPPWHRLSWTVGLKNARWYSSFWDSSPMLEGPEAPKLVFGSGCMVIKTQKIELDLYSSLVDLSTVQESFQVSQLYNFRRCGIWFLPLDIACHLL